MSAQLELLDITEAEVQPSHHLAVDQDDEVADVVTFQGGVRPSAGSFGRLGEQLVGGHAALHGSDARWGRICNDGHFDFAGFFVVVVSADGAGDEAAVGQLHRDPGTLV